MIDDLVVGCKGIDPSSMDSSTWIFASTGTEVIWRLRYRPKKIDGHNLDVEGCFISHGYHQDQRRTRE